MQNVSSWGGVCGAFLQNQRQWRIREIAPKLSWKMWRAFLCLLRVFISFHDFMCLSITYVDVPVMRNKLCKNVFSSFLIVLLFLQWRPSSCLTKEERKHHSVREFSGNRRNRGNPVASRCTSCHDLFKFSANLTMLAKCQWSQTYGYFRLIRARTGRFDLRYDSGVWFGVWFAGTPKAFVSAGIEPWA